MCRPRSRQIEDHSSRLTCGELSLSHLNWNQAHSHHITTSYHPIANGLVERFHRQLKAALKASPHPDRWTDMLPLVLLGIRTSLKEDINGTAAELVYGTSLRLPREFFVPRAQDNTDPASYVARLKSNMSTLHSTPTRKPVGLRGHIDSSLSSASHVLSGMMLHFSNRMMVHTESWIALPSFTPLISMVARTQCLLID